MMQSCFLQMPAFSKTLTIYNKFYNGQETVWYRTVLKNCAIKIKSHEKLSAGEVVYPNGFVARVPERSCCIPKAEWELVSQKEEFCTFSPGDLCFLGVVEEEIPKNTSGAEFVRRFGGFFIDTVMHNDAGPIPHWRLEGRENRLLY